MPRQSGLFGVSSSSSTSVAMGSRSASGVPGANSASGPSRTRIPLPSEPRPSSFSDRIMPSETTPRRRACLSVEPSGSTAPGRATATLWPAATLGAPHTIVAGPLGEASPRSTLHTFRRSALACGATSSTRPTRKCSRPATPWWWTVSTFVPVIVRRSSTPCASSGGSQYSRSQLSGTLIRTAPGSAGRSRSTGAGQGCRA